MNRDLRTDRPDHPSAREVVEHSCWHMCQLCLNTNKDLRACRRNPLRNRDLLTVVEVPGDAREAVEQSCLYMWHLRRQNTQKELHAWSQNSLRNRDLVAGALGTRGACEAVAKGSKNSKDL